MNYKRTRFSLMFVATLAAAMVAGSAPKAVGQEDAPTDRMLKFDVMPLSDADALANRALVETPGTPKLKTWTYSIKSTRTGSAGTTYGGVMVGGDPFTTKGTTTTTVYVVPLIVEIGSEKFDPTVPDKACYGGVTPLNALKISPMVLGWNDFKLNGVDVGATQYSDAFQRANFWQAVKANGGTYHNLLHYVFLPAETFTPDPASSIVYKPKGLCTSVYGGIEKGYFDVVAKLFLIPSLASKGVNPSNLVTFMLYNTTLYDAIPKKCCIGGYHGAYGTPAQTYSPFQYDTAGFFTGTSGLDVSIMSHEINEWQDDPFGNNLVPAWGHIGQDAACQGNLEVGDPLTGTALKTIPFFGSLNYHVQELAYFSWFFGAPSLGSGGLYSDNGTLKSPQGPCS